MIELSADLGEGAPREDELWPLIDAASVACGGHTGDERSMESAVDAALAHGVILGAHPSYPDREHFGRRSMVMDGDALLESLVAQMQSLNSIARRRETRLVRVKPHGALYNDAHRDAAIARRIVEAMRRVDGSMALVCSPTSEMARAARAAGLPVIREAFADRRYRSDGSLTPRTQSGSLLTVVEAVEQAGRITREGTVVADDGTAIPIEFDTICVHSDLEGAVERLLGMQRFRKA